MPTPISVSAKKKAVKRISNNQSMMDADSKLFDAQSQTERMMIGMEQRCMEFEERQMERDAQERKEERMFQLQMMQLMMAVFRGCQPSHSEFSMDSHYPHTLINPQP